MKTWRLVLGGLLFGMAVLAHAGDTAIQWLDRMVQATQMLNYEGTFIYLHGKQLESMSIVHQYDGKIERERLVSLNGEAREVIRTGNAVTCVWPNSKSVIVEHGVKKSFPAVLPMDLSTLEPIYQFELAGEDRVAQRVAQVIRIQPKDHYRYGFQLWLDKETALPLKSTWVDIDGRAIEQIMYTSLHVRDQIEDEKLQPQMMGHSFSWTVNEPTTEEDAVQSLWKVLRLPTGFTLRNAKMEQVAHSEHLVEHLIYTDGLTTISVYIEKESDRAPLAGGSQMGALSAYGLSKNGYFITVVGEVPTVTTQTIASSLVQQ